MKFELNKKKNCSQKIDGWKLIEKPPIRRWQLMVLPISIISMTIVASIWFYFTPAKTQISNVSFPLPIIPSLLFIITTLITHELIHTIFHPKAGFSNKSTIGFKTSKMLLYAIYNGTISRTHFIIILLMPFLTLTLGLTSFFIITQQFHFWIAYMSIVNAFVSAGDIFEIILVLFKVPKGRKIKRIEWDYYFEN